MRLLSARVKVSFLVNESLHDLGTAVVLVNSTRQKVDSIISDWIVGRLDDDEKVDDMQGCYSDEVQYCKSCTLKH